MDIVLDACSIINLLNGEVLQKVVSIQGINFYVGEYLYDEEILDVPQKLKVQSLIVNNFISIIESSVSVSQFKALKDTYELGDGETECIAICLNTGYNIATDDKKARESAHTELGDKVVGSLFLLRESVRTGMLSCDDAKTSFQLMKHKGGFLPKIDLDYFCT